MYLKMDKSEPDGCNLYLFWSSPNNTVGYSGDLITYNINVNGITYTSQDNMIVIPYEHRCDQLYFNATIQATNECDMTSLKASFENIRNYSDSPTQLPAAVTPATYTCTQDQPTKGGVTTLTINTILCIIVIGVIITFFFGVR